METVVLDSAQCKKHPEAASKVCVIVRRSDLRCEKELHLAAIFDPDRTLPSRGCKISGFLPQLDMLLQNLKQGGREFDRTLCPLLGFFQRNDPGFVALKLLVDSSVG